MNPRLFVLALSTFSFGSGAFIFAGLLKELAADLHVAPGVAGQLQTVYVLTSAFAGPLLANWLQRFDRKLILVSSLGIAVALNLLCVLINDFNHLIVIRAVLGATGAMAAPAASTAAAALAPPERRGSAMAIVSSGITVAFLMGIPLGTVVGSMFGWRACFGLTVAMSTIALLGVSLLLPRIAAPPRSATGRFTLAATLPTYLFTFFAFAANFSVSIYISVILDIQTHLATKWISIFQMVVGVGSLAGLTIGGRAADGGYGGRAVTVAIGCLILALASHTNELLGGAPPGWPTYVVVAITMVVASSALFSIGPINSTRLIAAAPASAPLALSLNGSAGSLGQAFAGAVGGFMLIHAGPTGITLSAMVWGVIALLLWVLWVSRASEPKAQAAEV
ncbi:MAG: MFS transporter [Caulobacteraceae bacterium]